MIGRDVMLRGRGAEIGVRAPGWLVRACGATLGVAIVWLGDALGCWSLVPVPTWALNMGALVLGALLAPSAAGGVLWLLSGLLTLVLMVVMYTPIVRPMIAPFVRADLAGAAPVDAVVVLSGTITADGRLTGQALDRLLSAMQIAKARGVGELLISVVSRNMSANARNSEADQRALIALAAPELTVHVVHDVHSTRDEALAFAAVARTRGWRRVVVVTSPMHSARACATVEMAGLAVECRPADGRDYSVRVLKSGEDRRLAFGDVVYEVLATALYKARAWMR